MRQWPKLRYETTSKVLQDIGSVSYPNLPEAQFYSFAHNVNPEYIVTNRNISSSSGEWAINNQQGTNRDSIFDFWNTTLTRGFYDYTMIDHRNRMLFDTSWNSWAETWKKARGGVSSITIDYESPFPWTPPILAAYFFTASDGTDHCLNSTNDLTDFSADFVVAAGDAASLRTTASTCRIQGDAGSAVTALYSSSTDLSYGKSNSSISVFCQCRVPNLANSIELQLIRLVAGSDHFGLSAYSVTDSADINFRGTLQATGEAAETVDSVDLSSATWYDVAFCYDANSGKSYLYYEESEASTWDQESEYMYDLTSTDDAYKITAVTNFPTATTWINTTVLRASDAGCFATSTHYAYIQNAMIFDDWISPTTFNWLRRMCHMWNNKTAGTWPK